MSLLPESHDLEALLAEESRLRALARALIGDPTTADVTVQETLEQSAARPLPKSGLRSYLGRALERRILRHVRSERRRHQHERRAAKPEARPSTIDVVAEAETRRQLIDAVTGLPEPYRSTIWLRYYEDLPPRRIAEHMGVPVNTVRTRVRRGLEQLRSALDSHYGNRSAWTMCLMPLAKGGRQTATTLATTSIGAILVKKILVSAAVLLLLLLATWMGTSLVQPTTLSSSEAPVPTVNPSPRNRVDIMPGTSGSFAAERSELVAPGDRVTIRVIDSMDRPVRNARVIAWDSGGEVDDRQTDVEGRAEFRTSPNRVGLVVLAEHFVPRVEALSEHPGERRIELTLGREVSGFVSVDGNLPHKPLTLTIGLSARPHEPPSFPLELRELLDDFVTRELVTGVDGSFRTDGVPPDQPWRLSPPYGYWFAEQPLDVRPLRNSQHRAIHFDAPRTGLRVALTKLPIVVGRVVWAGSGDGVSRASVSFQARFADGRDSESIVRETDDDGRFKILAPPEGVLESSRWRNPRNRSSIVQARISVRKEGGRYLSVEWDEHDLASTPTLTMYPSTFASFVVEDEDGRPIAGAVVASKGTSEPSAADGRCIVELEDPDATSVLVGAVGFQVEQLAPARGAGTTEDPYVLVLEAGNQLVVQLVDSQGEVPTGLVVQVSGSGAIHTGTELWRTPVHHRIESAWRSGGWSADGSQWLDYVPDGDGRVALVSLRTGALLRIAACDDLGFVVAERKFIVPGKAGEFEIRLAVDREPWRLEGMVFDTWGRAVAGARIILMRDDGSIGISTSADGSFRTALLYPMESAIDVQVQCVGYAPQLITVPVAQRTPLVVHLDAGNKVSVAVVDETGRAVPAAVHYEASSRFLAQVGLELGSGVFSFVDLPIGHVRFRASLAGQSFELRHDTVEPEARIIVPPVGQVTVVAPSGFEPADDSSVDVLLDSVNGQDRTIRGQLRLRDGVWQTDPLLVFPGEYTIRCFDAAAGRIVAGPASAHIVAGGLTRMQLEH